MFLIVSRAKIFTAKNKSKTAVLSPGGHPRETRYRFPLRVETAQLFSQVPRGRHPFTPGIKEKNSARAEEQQKRARTAAGQRRANTPRALEPNSSQPHGENARQRGNPRGTASAHSTRTEGANTPRATEPNRTRSKRANKESRTAPARREQREPQPEGTEGPGRGVAPPCPLSQKLPNGAARHGRGGGGERERGRGGNPARGRLYISYRLAPKAHL